MIRRTRSRNKPRSERRSWRNPERVRLDAKGMAQLRAEVFQRAAGRCENVLEGQRCSNKIDWWTGELHHLIHRSRGGSDTTENCIAVCNWGEWPCHRLHHDGKIRIQAWWKEAA